MAGTLTYSPADVVRRLLIADGYGTTPSALGSWPIYASSEPDSPDNCITVYDTAGTQHGRVQTNGEIQEHHGLMFRVRAIDFPTGYTKGRTIATALDTAIINESITVSGLRFIVYAITRTSDVLSLGKEAPSSKRNLFSINALVAMRQTN